jgi:hypothetical protein
MGVLVLLAGIGLGVGATVAAMVLGSRRYTGAPNRAPRAELPPATARQVRRARQASRADLGPVQRQQRIECTRLPSFEDFDREDTL